MENKIKETFFSMVEKYACNGIERIYETNRFNLWGLTVELDEVEKCIFIYGCLDYEETDYTGVGVRIDYNKLYLFELLLKNKDDLYYIYALLKYIEDGSDYTYDKIERYTNYIKAYIKVFKDIKGLE